MSGMTFEELTREEPEDDISSDREELRNQLSVQIEVAGPKETEKKTLLLSLNDYGLIKLAFKEGGRLPECLQGTYTDLKSVKVDLAEYLAKSKSDFGVDPEIKHKDDPAKQALNDLEAATKDGTISFDEKADPLLEEEADGPSCDVEVEL